MKKFQLWPWLALAGGCGAFLLRWAQLRLGFEADTGLPVPGDPWGVVLPLLLAALAILFLALSRGAPAGVTAEASLGRAFPVEKSLLPLLGGLLWLVSGAFQMMDAGSPEPVESFDSAFAASLSRGTMIAGILTVLSAVCLFCTLSPSPREGRRAEPNAVPLLGAAAALVVRLVLRYRALSMDPSLQAYYLPMVARTPLGEKGSAQPGPSTTPAKPAASQVRMMVPQWPGSCTPSSAAMGPSPSGRLGMAAESTTSCGVRASETYSMMRRVVG